MASTVVESSPDKRAVLFTELSALFPMGNNIAALSEFSSTNPTQDERVTLLDWMDLLPSLCSYLRDWH